MNIYAFSSNVDRPTLKDYADYFHAAFLIDWGNPTFDHLRNELAPGPGESSPGGAYPLSVVGVGLLASLRLAGSSTTRL